jgi:F-type H+-transporting ATPase subunit gamma
METLESLARQIGSVHDLESVVKTMKGLAAVNIRQYEQAVEALRDYHRTLELGLQVLLQRAPQRFAETARESGGRLAVVVVGSDQGMCGQFNSRIVDRAVQQLRRLENRPPPPLIIVLGARTVGELETSGYEVSRSLRLPGSVPEIGRRVEDLLFEIERVRADDGVGRVWLFHQRPLGGASYDQRFVRLMPLDPRWLASLRDKPWPTRMIPTFTMDWPALASSLVRQHLFVALYRALAESLAAENAARLASMQAAEKNVQERLDDLQGKYHQRRQKAITEELLDVTAGFEVLKQ